MRYNQTMPTLRHYAKFAFIPLVFMCLSGQLLAAELLMVEQEDCPHCMRFNTEIGHLYAKTSEGKLAPLLRLDLHTDWPAQYTNISKPPVTPTFILIHDGKEVDRLHGYDGDEFFWFLLGEMLEKLP